MIDLGPNGQPLATSNPADEEPGTCALCGCESHDGSEIELTEHDVEKAVGTYFVCERCLDARMRSKTWRTATVEALGLLTEAAHLSDDLHPLARAERVAALLVERDAFRAQLAQAREELERMRTSLASVEMTADDWARIPGGREYANGVQEGFCLSIDKIRAALRTEGGGT